MADEQGGLDRKILQFAAAGNSPEEISRKIGNVLPPTKVALRIHKLIDSPDEYLSIPQQIRLNLQMMRDTLGELNSRYLDDANAKTRLAYMKEIAGSLERLQKTNDTDMELYSANVGRAMAAAYDIALAHIGGRLGDRVPIEEWAVLKREALEVAQGEVAKKQLED